MDRVTAATSAPGRSFPLGVELRQGGANFSVFAKRATALELLLFERAEDATPARAIALDPHDDIAGWPEAPAVRAAKYAVEPRSIVLLMARTG